MDSPLPDCRSHPAWLVMDHFSATDGWSMRRFRAEPEGKARGSILFQTGRADFFEKYLEAIAHWRSRGWAVEGFDWRGQGGSGRLLPDPRIGHSDGYGRLVQDLADHVADWLPRTSGPHVLVGHSMGGHLILRLLAEKAPVVHGAVLLSPMLGLDTGILPEGLAHGIAHLACRIGLAKRAAWSDQGGGSGHRQRNLTQSLERFADELWWRAHDPMLDLGPPSWGWLDASWDSIGVLQGKGMLVRIPTPILVLYSERDRLVRPAACRMAAARLANVRLCCRPDAAHELLREIDPVRRWAEQEIDSFLEESGW